MNNPFDDTNDGQGNEQTDVGDLAGGDYRLTYDDPSMRLVVESDDLRTGTAELHHAVLNSFDGVSSERESFRSALRGFMVRVRDGRASYRSVAMAATITTERISARDPLRPEYFPF